MQHIRPAKWNAIVYYNLVLEATGHVEIPFRSQDQDKWQNRVYAVSGSSSPNTSTGLESGRHAHMSC